MTVVLGADLGTSGLKLAALEQVLGADGVEHRPDLVEIGGVDIPLTTEFGETSACLVDVHVSPKSVGLGRTLTPNQMVRQG